MAAATQTDSDLMSGINVTPLVDITLVLLVVFLVTAKIIAASALAVDLPQARTATSEQTILHVAIAKDGTIGIDETAALADEAILSRAKAALASDSEVRAVIDADGAVAHARVVHAMDLLRRAGLSRVAFGVEPEVVTP
ncbi:MAG TPA: biopolymer transporter ExbD [Myxococcota bacterium]|nr:biopolymer transporter ExbD [Myxococcota bacterium]